MLVRVNFLGQFSFSLFVFTYIGSTLVSVIHALRPMQFLKKFIY
jgi:hypothetical protein